MGFDLAVATHVPLSVGLEANLAISPGIVLRAHAGMAPHPYVALLGDVLAAYGAFEREMADAVVQSWGDAWLLRLSAGVRPAPGYGFEILAGYTMIHATGRASGELVEAMSGQAGLGIDSVRMQTTLHAVHAEIGYSAIAWDRLVLRFSLGWVHTLSASTELSPGPATSRLALEPIERLAADIRETLTTYGFSPEARVGVGYRF